MKKLEYITDTSTGIELVSMEQVSTRFREHTHTGHAVLGIVTEGAIRIVIGREAFRCEAGSYFSVAPDVAHAIEPETECYSLISICLPATAKCERELAIIREEILGAPELNLQLADYAKRVHVSSFHMLRKFTKENGITPHKFQLQCRVRKAQQLLAQGESVVDTALLTGFCDQSHLDRVFKQQVGISPAEYAKIAILSKPSEN